ncbi:hypothetical protein SMICM304S_04788 [Streptomyces microflavus]
MPVTNPWLAGPSPKKRLDRERLEERILNLLSTQNMCVLATAGPEGPLATPVRYFHLDFAVMFSTAPGSPKMRNLAADPRISVGIFAPLVGQAGSRGAQLFGRARVLSEDDPSRTGRSTLARRGFRAAQCGRPCRAVTFAGRTASRATARRSPTAASGASLHTVAAR